MSSRTSSDDLWLDLEPPRKSRSHSLDTDGIKLVSKFQSLIQRRRSSSKAAGRKSTSPPRVSLPKRFLAAFSDSRRSSTGEEEVSSSTSPAEYLQNPTALKRTRLASSPGPGADSYLVPPNTRRRTRSGGYTYQGGYVGYAQYLNSRPERNSPISGGLITLSSPDDDSLSESSESSDYSDSSDLEDELDSDLEVIFHIYCYVLETAQD